MIQNPKKKGPRAAGSCDGGELDSVTTGECSKFLEWEDGQENSDASPIDLDQEVEEDCESDSELSEAVEIVSDGEDEIAVDAVGLPSTDQSLQSNLVQQQPPTNQEQLRFVSTYICVFIPAIVFFPALLSRFRKRNNTAFEFPSSNFHMGKC